MAGDEQGAAAQTVIRPQAGPQTLFLGSSADIAIYGGSAGGGKTWALLMEPLRHIANSQFGAVFFRRTLVQVRNEGGLWDESEKLYPNLNAKPKVAPDLSWTFPSGSSVNYIAATPYSATTMETILSFVMRTNIYTLSASKERLNSTARAIVGTSLIGARGATPADQDRIDDTVAGLCGSKTWTREECARHDEAMK